MAADDLPDDWSVSQEAIFHRLYRHMIGSQAMFLHPGQPPVSDEHWQTTAWNAAWCAALFSDPDCGTLIHVEGERVVGTETPTSAFQ